MPGLRIEGEKTRIKRCRVIADGVEAPHQNRRRFVCRRYPFQGATLLPMHRTAWPMLKQRPRLREHILCHQVTRTSSRSLGGRVCTINFSSRFPQNIENVPGAVWFAYSNITARDIAVLQCCSRRSFGVRVIVTHCRRRHTVVSTSTRSTRTTF